MLVKNRSACTCPLLFQVKAEQWIFEARLSRLTEAAGARLFPRFEADRRVPTRCRGGAVGVEANRSSSHLRARWTARRGD